MQKYKYARNLKTNIDCLSGIALATNLISSSMQIQHCKYFQFNFVGKLLRPKGNSMKRLQEETMTKMAVLGRGSMRDKQKVSDVVESEGKHENKLLISIIYHTSSKYKAPTKFLLAQPWLLCVTWSPIPRESPVLSQSQSWYHIHTQWLRISLNLPRLLSYHFPYFGTSASHHLIYPMCRNIKRSDKLLLFEPNFETLTSAYICATM